MRLQGMHIPCYNSNYTGIIKGCVALGQFLTHTFILPIRMLTIKLRKMKGGKCVVRIAKMRNGLQYFHGNISKMHA